MNDTAIIKFTMNSETPIPPDLLRKIADAVVEVTRDVIEAEGNGQEISGTMRLMSFGEAKIVGGMMDPSELPSEIADILDQGFSVDPSELPPAIAAMFRQPLPRLDEYGATNGCECPQCRAIRGQAKQQIGDSGLIYVN